MSDNSEITAGDQQITAKQRGRPFKKGQSGNPNGAPKKEWTWRSLLLEVADEMELDKEMGVQTPKKLIMARKLVSKGMEGDTTAIKEFGDRVDGKSIQGVELTGKNGDPINTNVTITFVKPKSDSEETA